jgi:DNA primase
MSRSLSEYVARLEHPHTGRKANSLEVLQHVRVIDFLEHLDIANISQATADEVMFSCPFSGHSHGDEKPSAYMNDGSKDRRLTTLWKCHACGRSGNAISFLAEHEGITRAKATRWVQDAYAPGFNKPKDGISNEFDKRREQSTNARANYVTGTPSCISWDLYDQFTVDWHSFDIGSGWDEFEDVSYMYRRGFCADDLEQWRIGYDDRTARITIPVCDPDGNLLGVKARAWRKRAKPKYLILGDKPDGRKRYGFSPYEKSQVVFGIDKWGEQERYVLVEGEIDVMSLWKMGIPAFCTGGASLSAVQARIIREYADEIIIFGDYGDAGYNSIWGIDDKPGSVKTLEPFVRVRVVGPHYRDPNEYLVMGMQERVYALLDEALPAFLAERMAVL